MAMDNLSIQGYLGNQLGNNLYGGVTAEEAVRRQQEAFYRQLIAQQQNANYLNQGMQQSQQQKPVQPQPTDDHLLVLLTED